MGECVTLAQAYAVFADVGIDLLDLAIAAEAWAEYDVEDWETLEPYQMDTDAGSEYATVLAAKQEKAEEYTRIRATLLALKGEEQ